MAQQQIDEEFEKAVEKILTYQVPPRKTKKKRKRKKEEKEG